MGQVLSPFSREDTSSKSARMNNFRNKLKSTHEIKFSFQNISIGGFEINGTKVD